MIHFRNYALSKSYVHKPTLHQTQTNTDQWNSENHLNSKFKFWRYTKAKFWISVEYFEATSWHQERNLTIELRHTFFQGLWWLHFSITDQILSERNGGRQKIESIDIELKLFHPALFFVCCHWTVTRKGSAKNQRLGKRRVSRSSQTPDASAQFKYKFKLVDDIEVTLLQEIRKNKMIELSSVWCIARTHSYVAFQPPPKSTSLLLPPFHGYTCMTW